MKKKYSKHMIVLICVVALLLAAYVVRLWGLKRQVTTYREFWKSEAAKDKSEDALTYVALGDSAAQAIGASKPEFGYVGLIGNALKSKHNRPVHIVNLSVTGAKIQDVIDVQIPQLPMSLPKDAVVTIEIGANDMVAYNPERFRQQMDQLMMKLPKQTVVADMPYFGGGLFRSREASAKEASAIISDLAKRHGFRVAKLHDRTKENDSLRTYAADLFHPNNRGYQGWYRAFWQELDD